MNKDIALAQIKDEVTKALQGLGKTAGDAGQQAALYVQALEGEIGLAIEEADLQSLNLIRDRIAGHTARMALDLTNSARQTVTTVTMTVISMLIKFAAGVILV